MDAVWGTKDPEVFVRVVQRIKEQEPEVLRRVERAIQSGAPTHTVVWIVTNSILRGLNREEEADQEVAPGPATS